MSENLWLPKGFELPDGSKTRSLLFYGNKWQIFDTNGANNILLTRPELVRKWNESGLLDTALFGDIRFGSASFQSLSSHKKFALTPVEHGKSPESKVDALAFALAFKESRKLLKDTSFHDAVYVEQYSRLLPSWTLVPYVDDEIVFGTWITGGVVISTDSFRRLANLTGWIPSEYLAEIVKAAGFSVPGNLGLIAKRKSSSQISSDSKTPISKTTVMPERLQSQMQTTESCTFRLPGRTHLEEFFKEHIIDIIFNAEKYRAMGIDFPSAIILYGPPGCGKTFAVERLVEFIDWPSYSIDSSSIGSPYIHETSKKISEVFENAIDCAPSVIVIDEMEAFLSDRRASNSSSLYHVEEVAEFLRRIPLAIEKKVLIIAMTNQIEMIDPAILRRGRFDHIIEVGMPSKSDVGSLLDSLLSKLPKVENLNLENIIDSLTGKALSDSSFVIREAARLAAKAGKAKLDQYSLDSALRSLVGNTLKKSREIGFETKS